MFKFEVIFNEIVIILIFVRWFIPVGLQDINDPQKDQQLLIFVFSRDATQSRTKTHDYFKINPQPVIKYIGIVLETWKYFSAFQRFLFQMFQKCLISYIYIYTVRINLFDRKYSKNSNIVKYLKHFKQQFSIWIYSISHKWVHHSHFCKYFIIYFHVTTLKKLHFDTM